jgi:solute carrier family 8 (sodium/calcium exchanger)
MDRLAEMTSANVDSMVVHHNDWTSQIKDVIIPNINFI